MVLVCWFGLMGASCAGLDGGGTERLGSNVARYPLGGIRRRDPSLISFLLADDFAARIGRLNSGQRDAWIPQKIAVERQDADKMPDRRRYWVWCWSSINVPIEMAVTRIWGPVVVVVVPASAFRPARCDDGMSVH